MGHLVLAVFLFFVLIIISLFFFCVRFFKALDAAGSERAFAEDYLAMNAGDSEKNKNILGVALIGVWASFYLVSIFPWLGWPLFALSMYAFLKALYLCSLESWALKEVMGENEVDNSFRTA
ncbi:hypothetical protein [Burkholderia phage FLC9]|nr:hypothetical protein [Burkholderia phage FLC9]